MLYSTCCSLCRHCHPLQLVDRWTRASHVQQYGLIRCVSFLILAIFYGHRVAAFSRFPERVCYFALRCMWSTTIPVFAAAALDRFYSLPASNRNRQSNTCYRVAIVSCMWVHNNGAVVPNTRSSRYSNPSSVSWLISFPY